MGWEHLIKKDLTGSVKQLPGSGRPGAMRMVDNMKHVEALVLSQDDQPQTYCTMRQLHEKLVLIISKLITITL